MGKKNIIEFNGKVYNASTGELVNSAPAATNPEHRARATDGFIKSKTAPKKAGPKPAAPSKPKRPIAKQHPAHQPARSLTLMRSSVKKPTPKTRPASKTQPTSSVPAKHLSASPIAARLALRERRLVRAQQTAKDSNISHFKTTANDKSFKQLKPLPVKNPPTTASILKPAAKIEKLTAVNKLDNILEAGLAKATSHEQPAPANKKVKKATKQVRRQARKARWLIIIVLAVVIIATGIFWLVHSLPNLEFDIATSRSGVRINLPSYEPTGFRFSGPVQYAVGTLRLTFKSQSPGQKFSIVAQNSNWDTQTLLYSFVVTADPKYQTLQDANLTLYVYNQTNVTWVNGGVWYRLSSSNLSTNQLADIATSM